MWAWWDIHGNSHVSHQLRLWWSALISTRAFFTLFLLTELTLKVFFQCEAAHPLDRKLTFAELTYFLTCIVCLTLFWSFMPVSQHSPQIYWLGSTLRLPLTLEGVISFRFRSENLMIFYQTAHSMWAEMIYIPSECDYSGAQVRIQWSSNGLTKFPQLLDLLGLTDSWGRCIDLNGCKGPSTAQET